MVAFWATVAAHLLTWFGTSTVLRYAMTFQATLPVLCAMALARLAAIGGTPVAGLLAAALLGFNLVTHVAFVRDGEGAPWRPVDAAIARLEALGIHSCYADGRIAQVVTFESNERVLCTDYVGFRNYAFLRAVDRVDDPSTVAILAHRALRRPHPDVMAQALDARRRSVRARGRWRLRDLPRLRGPGARQADRPGWMGRAGLVPDRSRRSGSRPSRVDPVERAPACPASGSRWTLGGPYSVAQLTLAAAPWPSEAPVGLRVETSVDGSTWRTVASVREVLPGLHWWKGHPRVDDSGRVIVRMEPRPTRYVRLTETEKGEPGALWSIAELFVYEAATTPWEPPSPAAEAATAAERQLDHWMDDPAGPNPIRAPVTYEHRRAQVPWSAVFADANRALTLAPEWEGAHHLYGLALARAGWSDAFDLDVERAAADQAWEEVVRWAEQADTVPEGLWRRVAWSAGPRPSTSSAEVTPPQRSGCDRPRLPAIATKIRFGDALDLVGVDLPPEVRPGDTVTVRYHWRLAQSLRQDYWAFLHVRGLKDTHNPDQPIGARNFGTSKWSPGEEVRQSVTIRVPADTPPGRYPLHAGVWLPWTGKQLRASAVDLPIVRRAVVVGTLTVSR